MHTAQFLRNLAAAVPYSIQIVLIDNGNQFINQERHCLASQLILTEFVMTEA